MWIFIGSSLFQKFGGVSFSALYSTEESIILAIIRCLLARFLLLPILEEIGCIKTSLRLVLVRIIFSGRSLRVLLVIVALTEEAAAAWDWGRGEETVLLIAVHEELAGTRRFTEQPPIRIVACQLTWCTRLAWWLIIVEKRLICRAFVRVVEERSYGGVVGRRE